MWVSLFRHLNFNIALLIISGVEQVVAHYNLFCHQTLQLPLLLNKSTLSGEILKIKGANMVRL